MNLSELIPDNSENWIVRKNFLMFKKYTNIPVCYIEDDVAYIFLDIKIKKVILRIVKHFLQLNIEFYFTTPQLSSPKGIEDVDSEIIRHYLISYAQKEFFYPFKNMGFDFIRNMVKWADKSQCFDLIKINLERSSKEIERNYHDYFSNKTIYIYSEEIRDEFKTMYRDIQINKIL
jgi:hypothetical protein